MASRIQGITIELNAKATPLVSALRSVQNQIRTMKSGLRDVDKLLKFNPTNVALLTQKQQLLRNAITQTKDKLKTLKTAMEQMRNADGFDENSEDAQRLQREIIATQQELKRLESEYSRFASVAGAKMQAVGQKMMEVGDRIAAVGTSLTQKLTVPLALAGGIAVKKFAEVDKTMQLTNATMGNTTAQAELLDSAMKEAASNSTFGMSDAATATLNFARAGLSAEEAAAALAPAMNLAAGEGGELDTVSAGLVATINGFHGSFDEAAHYADVFANACNNSALDIDSLSQAMSVAAPVFSAAGYSVNDAALYMGVMANAGIEADKAANSLKTGISRLVKPTDEAAAWMDKLGFSIINADGTMKDTVTVQKELHDAFTQLSEAEQIAAASAIFGKNQMAPWLALINTAPADVDKLNDSLKKTGTTTEMAEAMMGGFGGAIEKLKSSIDVAATSFGQALAPTLRKVADYIQKAVDKFNSLSKTQKESIAKWALIAAAVGPALVVIGNLTKGVGGLVNGIGLAMSKLTALGEKVGILAGGPLALGLAAAAALAGGMYALNESGKRAAESLYGLNEAQKANLDVLTEATSKYKETVSATNEASAAVQSEFGYIRDLVGEYNSLVDANGQIAEADKARADFIINTLAESLGMEKSQIMDLVGANGQLTGAIDEVIQKKEAQAYLDANYDSYVQAIQLQTENTQQLAQALVDLNAKEEAAAAAKQRVTDAQNALNNYLENGGRFTAGYKTRLEEANRELQATQGAVDKAKEAVNGYADASADASNRIANYEALKAAAFSGSEAEIAQALQAYQSDLVTATNATQTELQAQAETTRAQYEAIKAAYDSGQAGITQAMVDAAKVRMDTAATEAGSVVGSAQQEANGVVSNAVSAAGSAVGNAIAAKLGVTTNYDATKTAAVGDFQAMSKSAATEGGKITSSMTSPAANVKKAYPVNLGSLFHGTIANITSTIKEIAGQRVSVPTVSGTTTFAKAYTNPFIFTAPTLIGGALVGDRGSFAGGEMIYSKDNLMRDISEAANPISAQELYGIIVAALDKADMKVNISGREFGRIIREY